MGRSEAVPHRGAHKQLLEKLAGFQRELLASHAVSEDLFVALNRGAAWIPAARRLRASLSAGHLRMQSLPKHSNSINVLQRHGQLLAGAIDIHLPKKLKPTRG